MEQAQAARASNLFSITLNARARGNMFYQQEKKVNKQSINVKYNFFVKRQGTISA